MIRWSFAFLIIALIAALFGFTHIAEGAIDIAKTLFFIFIVVWLLLLVSGLFIFKK